MLVADVDILRTVPGGDADEPGRHTPHQARHLDVFCGPSSGEIHLGAGDVELNFGVM